MSKFAAMELVATGDLPEYDLDANFRLDSHSFLQWEFRRWMASDMRWDGTHECKSMWFELLNLSHLETPVGTLPADLGRLARMIQPKVEAEHFAQLCQLKFGPLHGWERCRCDGDIRLMHPVVMRIVKSAFASRANHAARVEAASASRRLARLTEDVAALAPKLAEDPRKIRWIDDVIQSLIEQRGGARRTPQELHEAVQECFAQMRLGKFPEKEKA
ncbi:hypothetical protein DL1_11870 [Thioclava dalianensis]|uniref:Uncharacterized protein n=1 Tax=Thioclava dalianensis TaxID=1185766 RepID=A0A074TE11_9RHOB|nr:hypothetical protein [Thioclava dalianensis]KEP68405.1 hypothetical protein DL1_11870 [Thioclava dalianensis]SFN62291.1 hypothetical protein SAMN05216224_10838 [Thioclava dalianensis]